MRGVERAFRALGRLSWIKATLGRGVVGVISVYVEERRICPTLRRIVRLAVFSSIGMMFERRQVGDVSELESLSHGSTGVGRGKLVPGPNADHRISKSHDTQDDGQNIKLSKKSIKTAFSAFLVFRNNLQDYSMTRVCLGIIQI